VSASDDDDSDASDTRAKGAHLQCFGNAKQQTNDGKENW
jgi:hypothetical protein